jgi:hypothetical protein
VWLAVTSSRSLVFAKIDVGFSCPMHLEDYLMSLLFSDPIALKELHVQFLCKGALEGNLRRWRGRAQLPIPRKPMMTNRSTQIYNRTVFQDSNIHNKHIDVGVSAISSGEGHEGMKLEVTYLNRL